MDLEASAKAEHLRRALHDMLTQADIDLEMWHAMRLAREDDDVITMLNRRYGRFYAAAENALLNSLITILFKAYEDRKDTINLRNLRRALPKERSPAVEAELVAVFERISSRWKAIQILRNNVVGHQSIAEDRSEWFRLADVRFSDLRSMVDDMQHAVYLVGKHFHDTHVIFNLKGTATFDHLISDLRAFAAIRAGDRTAHPIRPPPLSP